jgi:hypothetical protein
MTNKIECMIGRASGKTDKLAMAKPVRTRSSPRKIAQVRPRRGGRLVAVQASCMQDTRNLLTPRPRFFSKLQFSNLPIVNNEVSTAGEVLSS